MKNPKPEVAPAEPQKTETVILLNFGDAPRVIYKPSGKAVNVGVGDAVTIELSERSLERIRSRDKTLITLPADIAEQSTGPFMKRVLDTLRDFDSITYERALQIALLTVGAEAFDKARPTKGEIRLALARRAKDAAHYIIAGAQEAADKLLGEGRTIDEELKPAANGVGLVGSDVVVGDPEMEDADGNDVRYFERPPGYVEPSDSEGEDGTDNEGNVTGDKEVADGGIGLSGADGGGNNEGDGSQGGEGEAGSEGRQRSEGEGGHAANGEGGNGSDNGRPPRALTEPEVPASPETARPPRPVKGE